MIYRPDWQPERRWQNRPVVRELDDHLVRWLLKMSAGLLVAIAPFGLYMLSMNATLNLNYRASEQAKELQRISEERRNLQTAIAGMESFEEIERWAVRECGLHQPEPTQVAVIPSGAEYSGDLVAQVPDSTKPTHQP